MSSMSNWTKEDLATLTHTAMSEYLTGETYCDHCLIVAIDTDDRYCAACIQDITDALWQDYWERQAVIHCEQMAIEQGWY